MRGGLTENEDSGTKARTECGLYLHLQGHSPLEELPDEGLELGEPRPTSQAAPSPCTDQSSEANVDTTCPRGKNHKEILLSCPKAGGRCVPQCPVALRQE